MFSWMAIDPMFPFVDIGSMYCLLIVAVTDNNMHGMVDSIQTLSTSIALSLGTKVWWSLNKIFFAGKLSPILFTCI